ncbi:hypothetical protein PIB30_109470, partial [Stylosanthes scabra]|nr:hypothetical protein [Stylosanthes scabra]
AIQHPEDEEAEECMRTDIIEELIKKVQQDEEMQKIKAANERYNVLKNTNQEFVLQEIQSIVQENKLDEVQADSATHMHPLVEEIQLRKNTVQPHEDNNMQQKTEKERQQDNLLQQNIQEGLQQKNKGEVQQKTKYATLKGRPSRMLNHLPTILKYAFLGNIKSLTCQCKMLVDISHMLNTMKHEVRKLWDPGK